jgi:hypothetical protein
MIRMREAEKAPPFDDSTVVDAAELGEWLGGLSATEVKKLALAGVLQRRGGLFPLKASIQRAVAHWERQASGGRLN